jgi:hypothetical protein
VILLLALLLSACQEAPTSSPVPVPSTISGAETTAVSEEGRVELDIFSGRPNPEWRLSAVDVAFLEQKLSVLPVATPSQPADPLGYRGFIVQIRQANNEATVTVQNGIVRTTRAGEVTHYKDPDRAVERWLLNTGGPFLDEDLFNLVERELPA